MPIEEIKDKDLIETFCRNNVFLHIYSIGDLDDFFWPYTRWYGLKEGPDIRALCLLYTGDSVPVLLALSEQCEAMTDLLLSISEKLPPSFYAHLSPGLETTMGDFQLISHGTYYKMGLRPPSLIEGQGEVMVEALNTSHEKELLAFYDKAYPNHWFDTRMLESNQYFGIRHEQQLVSVAGIHVYSKQYKVAALGNIATEPNFRGKGYSKSVTAKLCQSLLETVDHIGLNVKNDNVPAIACYQSLGFKIASSFEECTITKN